MRPPWAVAPLLLALCAPAVALSASAQGNSVWTEAPRPELPVVSLKRIATVGVQLDVNYQFNPDTKTIYGRNGPFALSIWGNVLLDERVGLGVVAGVQRRQGTGIAPSDVEPPETVLWQVPIALEGWLRMALWRNQPVVPYLRGGAGVVLWWERLFEAQIEPVEGAAADADAEEDEPRTAFAEKNDTKFTLHGGGGVQIRMPFPELQWEGAMGGVSVLSDVYLHIEGWARVANDFSREGMDLSAVGASAGLTLMF